MTVIDLSTPEGKAALQQYIEDATKGLVAKRDELLNEVKKLRKNSEIDPEEFNRIKDENEQLRDKLTESEKLIKKTNTELEASKKAIESESGFVQKLLIDNGLTEALSKAGVKPELAKAVKAMFQSQAQIKIDGENRNAVIGDKSLSDFIGDWAKSDEGKHFIVAPANGGGGANGSNGGNGGAKTMTRAEHDAMRQTNPAAVSAFFAGGGTLTD